MKYNLSYLGIRKQKAQFINNNNYLTIHFGGNSKNININYNIKDNESFNKTILSNNWTKVKNLFGYIDNAKML